ncbi:MAG: phage tail assembly chaperone [Pseudomonadota bacterium]
MSERKTELRGRDALAWRELMEIFLGQLGFTPDAFWKLSLREVDAALVGRFGARVPHPTRNGLDALMQQFPDKEDFSHG